MKQIITEVPAIIPLALAYACAKGSRYWYFYWAPSWLIEAGDFDTAQASFISSAIDIGNIFGLFIIGPLTTKNRFMSKPIPPLYAAFASTTGSGFLISLVFQANTFTTKQAKFMKLDYLFCGL